jgi:hypothetical protein
MTLKPESGPPILNLADVLRASEPRPQLGAPSVEQNKYAVRFANNMARLIASGLRSIPGRVFHGVLPDEFGRGVEAPARAVRGPKRLDVNYSTPQLGLALGISLKAVHIRETSGSRGYTHNTKRNDEELRVESSGYHTRQPFAVMIAVLFLPDDACEDARGDHPSSFGKWVHYLRPLTGRSDPGDDAALFERVFIGLYDPAGTRMEFFDVGSAPPKRNRPGKLLSFAEFLGEVKRTYDRRNHVEFEWSDENPEQT